MPLFDDFVKKPGTSFEYGPEHLRILEACAKDFWAFVPHVRIVHPDRGRIPFEPYPFQREILDTILTKPMLALCCSRQCGKCVQSDTLVTVRHKKTGKVETLAIGDLMAKSKG